jgi:putative DNA primase/helicase
MHDAIEQFRAALLAAGIEPPKNMVADGKLHRFSTNGKREDDAGWYVLHLDGVPAGAFGDWRTNINETWCAAAETSVTAEQRAELQRFYESARCARNVEQQRIWNEAADRAERLWAAALEAMDDFPYLLKKRVKSYGLKCHSDCLLVPVRDKDCRLRSLQFIDANGKKLFLEGSQAGGGYFVIGGAPKELLYIVEGYATGATVHEATGTTVVVAFNSGNLLSVAKTLREEFPGIEIVICADDDYRTAGNPGLTKANETAVQIGAKIAVPEFGENRPEKATDFNDMGVHLGLANVAGCLGTATVPKAETREGFDGDSKAKIAALSQLGELAYQRCRVSEAKALGVPVAALDKMVRRRRAEAEAKAAVLPHWHVDPWDTAVSGADLLDSIEKTFRRYIVLPKGGGEALALWTLHAWTADAGDVSPFMVLVSPTKRCGKTSVLMILYYLTTRSELASNISASALFRYVEEFRPTLLIDEADTFVRDNDAMRGILNSGHTKAAAHVIRNVESNGEHKPRRFSTWAPKAIATIRELADTLEDRAIVVTLQRKPKLAAVARLRKRDSNEFVTLRRQAARWAADNFEKLTDPDPDIPEVLNDRAADNWRPLLAIADLASGRWPPRAREAARLLSGEGHESSSINVELLADAKEAFGDKEAMSSADLVAALVADPERPWAEWRRGRPLTQKQLAGLLKPFCIISQTVHIPGFKDAKGYSRAAFEEAWSAYLPGQNASSHHSDPSDPSKCPNADEMGTSCNFRYVQAAAPDGSKNANLSYSDAGLDTWTDRKAENATEGEFDQQIVRPPADRPSNQLPDDGLDIPEFLRRAPKQSGQPCAQCADANGTRLYRGPAYPANGIWLHPECAGYRRSRGIDRASCVKPAIEEITPAMLRSSGGRA